MNIPNTSTLTLADAALKYAQANIPIFPIRPESKAPLSAHGKKDATVRVTQIRDWWRQHPKANIAAPTGDVFDVLDIDTVKPDKTVENIVSTLMRAYEPKLLEELFSTAFNMKILELKPENMSEMWHTFINRDYPKVAKYPIGLISLKLATIQYKITERLLPITFKVKTGSGGLHYYINSQHIPSKIGLVPFVDLLSLNHQIILPPSMHALKRPYTIIRQTELVDYPPGLANLFNTITQNPKSKYSNPNNPNHSTSTTMTAMDFDVNTFFTREVARNKQNYIVAILTGITTDILTAPNGRRRYMSMIGLSKLTRIIAGGYCTREITNSMIENINKQYKDIMSKTHPLAKEIWYGAMQQAVIDVTKILTDQGIHADVPIEIIDEQIKTMHILIKHTIKAIAATEVTTDMPKNNNYADNKSFENFMANLTSTLAKGLRTPIKLTKVDPVPPTASTSYNNPTMSASPLTPPPIPISPATPPTAIITQSPPTLTTPPNPVTDNNIQTSQPTIINQHKNL